MKAYKVDKFTELYRNYLSIKNELMGGGRKLLDSYLGYDKLLPLSDIQKRQAKEYWLELTGKTINTRWHQLLYTKTGEFKVSYMPFEIYSELISCQIPSDRVMSYFDDKCLYKYFLRDFSLPYRVVECCEGVYYLPEVGIKEVSLSAVLERCNNLSACIIKPSKGSSAGIGVKMINTVDGVVLGENRPVESLIASYNGNFVIEKRIEESECLARLNPSSCNTLRIHTWRNSHKEKCEFISAYVRIGRSGKVTDNASTGGITCQVMNNGKLGDNPCIVNPYTKIDKTDADIELSGYQIDGYQEMVDTAIQAHSCLPLFGIIGWDICMNNSGTPTIIEFNPNPDLRIEQLVFRDTCLLSKQEEILKEVFENRVNAKTDTVFRPR